MQKIHSKVNLCDGGPQVCIIQQMRPFTFIKIKALNFSNYRALPSALRNDEKYLPSKNLLLCSGAHLAAQYAVAFAS